MPYSLKNKKTKDTLLISILNPLINSLSPSNKSKGARFVSIKESTLHNKVHSVISSNLRTVSLFIWNPEKYINAEKNNKIRATSKERLCSIPRRLPNLEKALTLLQPVRITA